MVKLYGVNPGDYDLGPRKPEEQTTQAYLKRLNGERQKFDAAVRRAKRQEFLDNNHGKEGGDTVGARVRAGDLPQVAEALTPLPSGDPATPPLREQPAHPRSHLSGGARQRGNRRQKFTH